MASRPAASTSSAISARSAAARSIAVAPSTSAKSRTRRSSRPAMRGVPRARRAISLAPSAVMPMPSTRAPRLTISSSSRLGIEVEPDRNAEAVAQRIGEQPRARGRADERELRQVDLDRARRRPLADDQVELKVLHRRIEDFLDRRIEPVDLVDEQHVALFEIGEQRREVAGLGDHRSRGGAEVHAELARHDLRQRGLAEPGRADEQHVVERFPPRARGLDEHRQIRARLLLADELGEPLRPQRGSRPRRRRGARRSPGGGGRAQGVVLTGFVPGCTCSATVRRSRRSAGRLAGHDDAGIAVVVPDQLAAAPARRHHRDAAPASVGGRMAHSHDGLDPRLADLRSPPARAPPPRRKPPCGRDRHRG